MVLIENLIKTYGQGDTAVEALKGINLHIQKGEIFGIIGLSGAGKSSLVRCINLLETPTWPYNYRRSKHNKAKQKRT